MDSSLDDCIALMLRLIIYIGDKVFIGTIAGARTNGGLERHHGIIVVLLMNFTD